ncbi:recQ family helicase, partial [Metarhizium brunneum ARSEF 3297]
MARLHYAVHIGMPNGLTPEMMENYRGISRLWHQFLMEGGEARAGWKRKAAGGEMAGACKRSKTGRADKEENERYMVDGLRLLMGPASTWRPGKQRECMEKILVLDGDQQTWGGRDRVPAVSQFRTRMLTTGGADGTYVVVSADTALVLSLLGYIEGLGDAGLLQRIFIDEADMAITDALYRAKLTQLKGMTRFERPIMLLTATMPVTFERWFREELLANSAEIIRDRATKLNCRYELEQVKPGAGAV